MDIKTDGADIVLADNVIRRIKGAWGWWLLGFEFIDRHGIPIYNYSPPP